MNRRGFLTGLVAALAAPAVVRSGLVMPLRGIAMPIAPVFVPSNQLWSIASEGGYLYSDDLADALIRSMQPLTKFEQICGELGRYDGVRIIG